MSSFSPIAIVGRACVLPGALDPEALWKTVVEGRSWVGPAPVDRWGVRPSRILCEPSRTEPDHCWSDRGGYVRAFEKAFNPEGFELPAQEILDLDPLFQWLLHTGRASLDEAAWKGDSTRAGVVIGNLSYPASGLSAYAEEVWLRRMAAQRGDEALLSVLPRKANPANRFMSGLPAHLLAQALGLGGEAFALDAACASSLYAIKLACDALNDGRADLMLAGAVNRADDLFLHVGFTALQALSQSGQSRPFHPDADGLLPAEGACLFALRRLQDAEQDGSKIFGVIRGVGLSNDGRSRGMLVPSQAGQVRAVRRALDVSGLSAADLGFVECHATGTAVGDATEIASLREVFGDRETPLPIGSFKANVGHLITAAGGAGLMKMLAAMDHEQLPPTPHLDALHPDLEGSPLRLLHQAEPWDSKGPRRAGISAFGFGGNNAHLIVEQYLPKSGASASASVTAEVAASLRAEVSPPAPKQKIAIVALGARVGDGKSAADFESLLFDRAPGTSGHEGPFRGRGDSIEIPLKGLRFPPSDLEETLPQQLLILEAAREAAEGLQLDPENTAILIGMQCDAEVARHGARWRMSEWARDWGCSPDWVKEARDAFVPLLGAAGVIGAMPNVVANRLNSHFDFLGPSYSVSSEELSGVRALELACRALEQRELSAVLVGAVDLCAEEVHESAARELLSPDRQRGGDAAVVLVLKRLDDAQRDGDRVLALVDLEAQGATQGAAADLNWTTTSLAGLLGHAHAASGLLHVAAAAIACARGVSPASVRIEALGEQKRDVHLSAMAAPLSRVFVPRESAAGPLLSLPMHPEAPHLPPFVEGPSTSAQPMAEAPSLPSVLVDRSEGARAIEGKVEVGALVDPALVSRHLEMQRALSQAHQDFIGVQASAHAQFLHLRSQLAQSCLNLRGSEDLVAELPGQAPLPVRGSSVSLPPPGGLVSGPAFSRQDLEVHASGRISSIFGEKFKGQDRHELQVRMPEAPLLLADRIVGIEAEPDSMGVGVVWSETDVREDTWFVHKRRVPAGILIECGQADLFLISYLGIDRLNAGQRAYRLLGCELTYHGSAPGVGDTLHYDIHVDSHAHQGDVRLFFFHSDCHVGHRPIMSVRNGQAGFFTEKELAHSAGVLWSAEEETPVDKARLDPPRAQSGHCDFDEKRVGAFAQGDLFACFGPGFERGQSHTDSPRIQHGDMGFIDRIEALDRKGGPWKRGYARAHTAIHSEDWFFKGHFKNDPCMPGTLMFEGCLQLMAFYLASQGYTLERDGWRFEPVPELPYQLHCRGQVLPSSKELVCEIFVEEVWDGPEPTVFAHLLGTVDGRKAFHARHVGLRLVPDWPLASRPELLGDQGSNGATLDEAGEQKIVAQVDGFEFGYPSLLACAWGKPSEAFGPMYQPFDGTRRVARLPGPPYHFMSRVRRVQGPIGGFESGSEVEIEYDVPPDAWYFENNGAPSMPFAVLLEVALQPCGWLASYVGSALQSDQDLSFRNLDGSGTVLVELSPECGTLRTHARLTNVSKSGDMIIQSFEVQVFAANESEGEQLVYELKTVFGFFPAAALANQVGLSTRDSQRETLLKASSYLVDLSKSPSRYFEGSLRLAAPMLCMIDRVSALDPQGGEAGLGSLRAEKDVNPEEWFFKAHFFQDPVQPGSLGIEVMLQLLQFYLLETESAAVLPGAGAGAYFEAIETGAEMSWKYRGQVVPENRLITTTLEITEKGRDERGVFARAKASLWVDGKRIYEALGLGMRICQG